jgi:mannose-1-phosphate guanylyltransferase
MVLAAGLGTRLRPLTDRRPKPLAPVGDRPQIDHVLRALAEAGLARAVVNTHHLGERFDDRWLQSQPLEVRCSREAEILGTAGGLRRAASLLDEGDVLVWNADILAELDVARLLAHHERTGALATLVVAAPASGRGTVGLAGDGSVARLRGFGRDGEARGADYAGIAVVGDELRRALPEVGCLVGDVLLPALERGGHVQSFALEGRFRDTGTLRSYLDANLGWLEERGLRAWKHPSADVAAHVSLEAAIVGEGAVVNGQGPLERVVVWPGALATAPLCDAVVTPFEVVPVPVGER